MIPSGEPDTSTPIKREDVLVVTPGPATPVDSVRTDYSGTDGSRENVGLQSDHTTPAHMLLETWPSTLLFIVGIEYLKKLKENNQKVSDYAMQLEQDRGLLRIWGVGEEPGSPKGSIYSNVSSPALGKDDHPPSDHSKSSTANGSSYQDSTEFEGGLGPDGRPDFDFQVLQQLYDSYMQNMHNLHPFLNPREIHTMVEEFGEHVNAMPTGRPGVKRKRSTSHFGEPHLLGGAIERSLRNAIVLLILAIGKVCSYKGKVLPAPQIDSSATAKGTWGCTRDFSRRNASFDNEPSEDRLKNIEILPGMAYFAYAMDILGYQHGGNTAAHAQAMILAALYLSQYSRVLESWSWIESACRVTELLIKA